MTSSKLTKLYFKWICQLVGSKQEYSALLGFLNSVEFTYILPMDKNRYEDGIELRYRFSYANNLDSEEVYDILDEPCSVLEMMAALALRCEENIMGNITEGDRTSVWFWDMIKSLGLIDMTNEYFDIDEAENIILRFLDRDYERTGRGGLFTIRGRQEDMRDVEIWTQLNWYVDPIE